MPETSLRTELTDAVSPDANASSEVNEATLVDSSAETVRQYPAPDAESVTTLGEIAKNLISVVLLLLAFGLAYFLSTLAEEPKDQSPDQLITRVSTAEVKSFVGQIEMEVAGTVVPYREIRMAAEVSGNIIKKYPSCEAGNFVRKGEKLLEIDPEDYHLQLATRKAELAQSETMLAETNEELDGAEKSLKLAEKEFKIANDEFSRNQRIQGALSSSEMDQSKRALLSSETALTNRRNSLNLIKARVRRMESAIELSKSQLKRAELNLSKAVITAPDDGIIVSESVQEGEFVNAGKELVVFEDTSRSEVICNLSPRDLDWIRENSPLDPEAKKRIEENKVLAVYYLPRTRVKIYEPERDAIAWNGVLERFDGIGRDNRSRTIPTRITIAEPVVEYDGRPHALVRNMYVKCQIQVPVSQSDADRKFVCFPELALRPDNSVWLVTKENKLKKVWVEIVDRNQVKINDEWVGMVVLRLTSDSLQPGDSVVQSPIPSAFDGMDVQLDDGSSTPTPPSDEASPSGAKLDDGDESTEEEPSANQPSPASDVNTLKAPAAPE